MGNLSQFNKFWIACGGLVILLVLPIATQQFGINYSQVTQIVVQAVISALTAGGVYQVANKPAEGQ